MTKSLIVSLAAVLLLTTLLLAHGAPLMGTVTAVGKDSITISDKDGKSIVVGLESATKYLKDKKPAAMADIKVGTRVVIDAHMDEKTKSYKAESVQIGVSGADTKAPSAKKAAPKPNN
jgi:hypothetical protein